MSAQTLNRQLPLDMSERTELVEMMGCIIKQKLMLENKGLWLPNTGPWNDLKFERDADIRPDFEPGLPSRVTLMCSDKLCAIAIFMPDSGSWSITGFPELFELGYFTRQCDIKKTFWGSRKYEYYNVFTSLNNVAGEWHQLLRDKMASLRKITSLNDEKLIELAQLHPQDEQMVARAQHALGLKGGNATPVAAKAQNPFKRKKR